MRFTADPHRFLSRLQTTTAPGELRRVERVLATTRLFLATSFLAAIYVVVQALRKAPTEQELANCAILAIAFAVIPHCLARAVDAIVRRD